MSIASNFVKIQLSQNSTKFDWVTRFRDEFNGAVCFVIRDLENFLGFRELFRSFYYLLFLYYDI